MSDQVVSVDVELKSLSAWFWNDQFWLPPNVTWNNLRSGETQAAYSSDLAYPLALAWVILLVRKLVEKFVFRPLGQKLGLKDQGRLGQSVSFEPTSIRKERCELSFAEEQGLERWLRQRRLLGRPTKLDKFSETGWRWLYYTSIFGFGLVSLWGKDWFWDISDCWTNYPHHQVDRDVWWYYITELSFYWGLFFSQFVDVRRKDFWVMFVHHVTTILLMCFSWTCNFFKVGTLVLLLHDCADIFLETAKLLKYAGYKQVSEIFFGGFAVAWIVTRICIFPLWIIYSVVIEAPKLVQLFPAYYLFNGLLALLLVLNVGWSYFILKVAYLALFSNTSIANDARSDDSSESGGEENENSQLKTDKKGN